MKRLAPLLVFFYILVCTDVSAQSLNFVFTGKEMYESCTHALTGLDRAGEYDNHRFGVCAGYIAGIVDFHTVASTVESFRTDMFCLPPQISIAQVIRSVTQYLENNPGKHHELAAYVVILALREGFPCEEDNSS